MVVVDRNWNVKTDISVDIWNAIPYSPVKPRELAMGKEAFKTTEGQPEDMTSTSTKYKTDAYHYLQPMDAFI